MAITNSDGSIILSTQVDTKGIDKGMTSIRKSVAKIGSLMAAAFSVHLLRNFAKEAKALYKVQLESEIKLATVMRQRMSATDEQIKKIMELTAAEQALGVIGDEVQMAGLQQLATFAKETKTLEVLLPEMNNLLAQQEGYTVSTGSAVNVANLMGKVLQGQVGALTRVGISFSEAEEQVLKYGTESERAATLAQVIRNNVGSMNKALAQTDVGRQQQLANTFGDIKEQFGQAFTQISILFLPVLKEVARILSIVATYAQKASQYIAMAMGGSSNAEQWKNIGDEIQRSAEEQENLNAAQEKYLAGFDKVTKISDSSSGGGGAPDTEGTPQTGGQNALETASEDIASKLMSIMAVAGVALMAIGLVLLTFGHIGWGLGFIIAGAASAGVAIATMRNGAIDQTVKDAISNALIIAGIVAIVLGILICMAQHWALGIGLIILGASSIVSAVALNWNGIVSQLQGTFGKIMAIVSGALIVIGIILCLTQVGIPLGIGLILAGATGLATVAAANKNAIVKWIKDVWNNIKAFWNANIAPIFTAAFWLQLAKDCGNGLIGGFEAAINGIISLFEKMINFVVDALNLISIDVPDWVPAIGGKKFGFNLSNVDFGEVSIPRLAQGSVIPPNKQFMAVLGDNTREHEVVSPLSTIKQAVSEALNGSDGGNIELTVLLDSDIIFKKVVQRNRQNTIRTGKNALAY